MKALVVVLLLAFVALAAANWLELQRMQQSIVRIERQIAPAAQPQAPAEDPVATATRALGRARQALDSADVGAARRSLADALQSIEKAGERAGPAAKWLREQATDLSREVSRLAESK